MLMIIVIVTTIYVGCFVNAHAKMNILMYD